jgi:hypothetical protein
MAVSLDPETHRVPGAINRPYVVQQVIKENRNEKRHRERVNCSPSVRDTALSDIVAPVVAMHPIPALRPIQKPGVVHRPVVIN